FFQAEDGIRDFHVTGVQTCALPISREMFFIVLFTCPFPLSSWPDPAGCPEAPTRRCWRAAASASRSVPARGRERGSAGSSRPSRSEERRVGKEWTERWAEADAERQ